MNISIVSKRNIDLIRPENILNNIFYSLEIKRLHNKITTQKKEIESLKKSESNLKLELKKKNYEEFKYDNLLQKYNNLKEYQLQSHNDNNRNSQIMEEREKYLKECLDFEHKENTLIYNNTLEIVKIDTKLKFINNKNNIINNDIKDEFTKLNETLVSNIKALSIPNNNTLSESTLNTKKLENKISNLKLKNKELKLKNKELKNKLNDWESNFKSIPNCYKIINKLKNNENVSKDKRLSITNSIDKSLEQINIRNISLNKNEFNNKSNIFNSTFVNNNSEILKNNKSYLNSSAVNLRFSKILIKDYSKKNGN